MSFRHRHINYLSSVAAAVALVLCCLFLSVRYTDLRPEALFRLHWTTASPADPGLNRTDVKTHLLTVQKAARESYAAKWRAHTNGIASAKQEVIVHFFQLFNASHHQGGHAHLRSVSFMECLSLLSVLKNLQPDRTLIHTNVPDFWPFENCSDVIRNWTSVEIVPVQRKFLMNGQRFISIEHEADVMKLETLYQYGGLALDFDVYIINGARLRETMRSFECFMCDEKYPDLLNAGFIGCAKGSRFPKLVLERSYQSDFRPLSWLWNSGRVPFQLAVEDPSLVEVVQDVCNIPAEDRANVLEQRGFYNWTEKMAYHTFYHNSSVTAETLRQMNSSFGDLLNWIMSDDPLPGMETPGQGINSIE
ncbi:hypothetical protein BV898_10902 [Hypsibius exemplaris]|uniref:Alpha-1,4-N-acetylglucosaminyltransferase n=1 Tax=Hypsibius exemplaris TaxID=2072580 RepID=A0A1W0WI31_HYPEX|nr:hypothetical protein BV898_10902 [Hypsibius exemplaris]